MCEARLKLLIADLLIASAARPARAARADKRHRDPIVNVPPGHEFALRGYDSCELVAWHVWHPNIGIVSHPAVPITSAKTGRLHGYHHTVVGGNGVVDVPHAEGLLKLLVDRGSHTEMLTPPNPTSTRGCRNGMYEAYGCSRIGGMTEADRIKYLRLVLLVAGVFSIVGFYPLTILWPSGWTWHTGRSEYLQMILGIYATLGVFLIIASKNPLAHRSLIWFAVWSSVVHSAIMAVQSLVYPEHVGHLLGDVPVLFVVAALITFLMPRAA
jgi:hypothetical protein